MRLAAGWDAYVVDRGEILSRLRQAALARVRGPYVDQDDIPYQESGGTVYVEAVTDVWFFEGQLCCLKTALDAGDGSDPGGFPVGVLGGPLAEARWCKRRDGWDVARRALLTGGTAVAPDETGEAV